MLENDAVDWNGDGTIDGSDDGFSITNFSGISSLTLSDRDASGNISAYFTADAVDASGLELEAAFRVTVQIPEPGCAVLLMLAVAGLSLVRRR